APSNAMSIPSSVPAVPQAPSQSKSKGTSSIAPPRRTQAMPMVASAIAASVTPRVNVPTPAATPPAPSVAIKPITPVSGGVTPIKPVTPGAPGPISPVSPIKPIVPGAIKPLSPGQSPPKPASATPAPAVPLDKKSGTAVIKNAPPKETARITVKSNIPSAVTPAGGVRPTVKAVAPVVAAAAAVGAAAATVKGAEPVKVKAASTVPVNAPATGSIRFEEPPVAESTTLTTGLAAALAVLTWGIAGFLFASVYSLF
ncbi:MAG TPA: hypothetical protein VGC39_06975, partial [Candidatus Methylacidiphilales bacterium]